MIGYSVKIEFAAFVWNDDPEIIEMIADNIATSLYYEAKLKEMGISIEEPDFG